MKRDYLQTAAAGITILFPVWLVAGHVAADIALSAIALLFLIRSAIEKDWGWCHEPWVQCLALLWFYIVLRSLFAGNPSLALHRSLPFARYFLFAAALACWLFQNSQTRRSFFIALCCTMLFLSLDGLVQWSRGYDLLHRPFIIDTMGHLRLTGPFPKPILGIMLAWLSFPAFIPLLVPEKNTPMSASSLLSGGMLMLLILATIVLSGERIALLLMLLGGVSALLLLPVRTSRIFAVLAAWLFLIGAIALISPEVFSRHIHLTMDTLQHWQQSPYGLLLASDMELVKKYPVFGIGSGHFNSVCQSLHPANPQSCSTHPHNIYLEWLVENGVIGFVMFLSFLFLVCRKCCKTWPQNRLNPFFAGLLIALILRIWPFASSTNFFSAWGAPPFWLVLGALLSYTARKEVPDADTSLSVKNSGL